MENKLTITIISNNDKGISFFKTGYIKLLGAVQSGAYNLGNYTDFLPEGQLQFRHSKLNQSTANWHVEPDPYGRLIIYLSGTYKITVGSKDKPLSKIFKGGDILFFEDKIGSGHITEVLQEGDTLLYRLSSSLKFIE